MSPDYQEARIDPRGGRPAQRQRPLLDRIGQAAPYGILVYVIALATLRISFSPYLEVDESEFVGLVDFRLVYENAHPPLFNWLMRIALEITAWDWASAAAMVRYGALGVFYLAIWDTARRLAGPRAAVLTLAAAAFLPQIVWMSVTTLAHTTLAMALAAASLNMLIRVFEDPTARNYALFGLVAGLGMLTKFTFPLFLVPFVVVTALEPELRYAFGRRALIALGAFLAVATPMIVAALLNLEDAASRAHKLYGGSSFSVIDPPFLGVDGVLTLMVAALAWSASALAIWAGARIYDRTYRPTPGPTHPFAPVIGRAMAYGLAGFAAGVLLFDVHKIEERYLTPLLAALPVYLAVAWPLRQSAGWVVGAAAALFAIAPVAFALMVEFGPHRYAIPYERVAAQIARQTEGVETPIVATRHDDAANLVLALGWRGAATPRTAPVSRSAMLVWRGRVEAPTRLRPEGFGPARPIVTVVAPLDNLSGREIVYRFQLFEALPPGAELIEGPEPSAPADGAAEPGALDPLGLIEADNLVPE